MNDRQHRAEEILMHAASDFINRESNRRSMITVTGIETHNKGKKVLIFVSVFPETGIRGACEFLNRNRSEFRDFVKKNTRLNIIPFVEFLPSPVLGGVVEEETEA